MKNKYSSSRTRSRKKRSKNDFVIVEREIQNLDNTNSWWLVDCLSFTIINSILKERSYGKVMLKQILLYIVFIGLFLIPVSSFSADNPVDDISQLTRQWIGLEHQKDLLQANWRRDKPVLEQQLSLLNRESRKLTQLLEESAQARDEVEQRRLELLEKQTRFEQEQGALERSLRLAGIRLKALRSQLPPPLLEGWEKELLRLEDPLHTSSEKLQMVLNLLSQLDDFQQKVTLNETVMTLADGKEYLVKQVFLGLSHGWYVTADKSHAAAGMAASDGWRWTPVTDGERIARIIAILERRMNPELITIPLQLNARAVGEELR